jgi:xanthine dehydrogenase YagR molybdenum-binding subunit
MARTDLQLGFGSEITVVAVDVPEGEPRPWDASDALSVVGRGETRIDGEHKVSGRATYTHDVRLPDMLYAAVLRCPLACAKVSKLSLGKAMSAPGVAAGITLAKVGDRLLFAGQDVAAIAATRPELARDALAAIEVEYEALPFVVDTLAAASPSAPVVHQAAVKERRTEGDEPGGGPAAGSTGNVRKLPDSKRGNPSAALAKAATVHEATYHTAVQTHSALETHGIVVRWDAKDKITAWCSTQGIFSVRDELAEVFEIPVANVSVITEYLGGGFGAKFGASAPGTRLGFIAGELARKAGKPVKLMCDRHEEQVCTGNRPDSHQEIKLGADKAGRLVGLHVRSLGTAGIGTGAGIGRNAFSIYSKIPHVLVESSDVFTNAGPGTAMRAPGHPQGAFAIELAIDELARKLGRDPLRMRIDHDEHPVRKWQFEEGATRFGWAAARERSADARKRGTRVRTGVGVAASIWGDFGRPGVSATVSVARDGRVVVRNGVQDIGTGIGTVMAQVVAEVLRRPLSAIAVEIGRSEHGPSVGSGGSTTTASVTPAVRNAAEKVKADLVAIAATALGVDAGAVVWGPAGQASGGGKSLTFEQLCKKMPGEAIVATASRAKTFGAHPMAFMGQQMQQIAGVQFAEVEVDTWTGEVRAKRVLAMHDCGRVMNRLLCRSQINGGIILGTSYALLEERVFDRDFGRMLNPNLEHYKIAGARDIPQIEVVMTDVHAGNNSTGAIGIGEPATIPTAAAIACAVHDALGVAVRSLPITPAKILAALGAVPPSGGPT